MPCELPSSIYAPGEVADSRMNIRFSLFFSVRNVVITESKSLFRFKNVLMSFTFKFDLFNPLTAVRTISFSPEGGSSFKYV
jgi:hypothetical protein